MRGARVLAVVLCVALSGCAQLPALDARVPSTALLDTEHTWLGRAVTRATLSRPGLVGIHPLVDGRDAFAARAVLAQVAERSLDVQYYIWRGDTTGLLLIDALKAAADRGVRVRLLLDDNGTAGLDALLVWLDAHPQVEVRLFNPFASRSWRMLGFVSDFSRLNRRMHNKSFTADNQVTIVGGRNVGDEYFGAQGGVSFADLDVMATGPVVQAVSDDFDRYWNSASAYPVDLLVKTAAIEVQHPGDQRSQQYLDAVRHSAFVERLSAGSLPFEWARTRLVSDDPAKVLGAAAKNEKVAHKLRELLGEPQQHLDLVSPYFVPGQSGTDAFVSYMKQGAKVRILTNSLEATDVAAVHSGYIKWRKPLLASGVTLYELRRAWTDEPVKGKRDGPLGSSDASLHAKTFAVDGERVFVGSFNFDPRSVHLNTEMGLVIDSPVLAAQLTQTLDRNMPTRAYEVRLDQDGSLYWLEQSQGKTVRHNTEPGTSWWKRTTTRFLSWLPIDWLL